jgi:hypothetical protein
VRTAPAPPPPVEPELTFATAGLRDGFIAAGISVAILPSTACSAAARRAHGGRTSAQRRRGALRSFADLRTGDIVVHEDHGLARFAGFETKTVGGVTRDYLQLEFAGTDKVFMPVDQLAKISRYVGAGGAHPPLSKLGGKSWETMKARARRAAQELAGELINLYAERRRRTGYSFAEDSDWQRDFEGRWPYQETADQRDAIEIVKADMERPQPMDRLICGDVGYGKTEVALRAAFKAAATASRCSSWRPRRSSPSSTSARSPSACATSPSPSATSRASAPRRSRRRRWPRSTRARSTSSSAPTGCSAATCARRTSGCSWWTRSSASASSRRSSCASSSCGSTSSP